METVKRRRLKGIEQDRAFIRSAALKILHYIESFPSYRSDDVRRDWLAPQPLSAFTNLEPIGFGLDDGDEWLFHPDDCTADLVWPLNVGLVTDENSESDLIFSKNYTVTAKQVRGYASRISPRMVRTDAAQVDRGVLIRSSGISAWLGGKWVDAQKRTLWSGRHADVAIPERPNNFDAHENDRLRLCTSIGLKQRYEWAVTLGLENLPSIRFVTDPTGIKEVYKVRDLPEGQDRRAALVTWVTDHWRQHREDPDVELYVRKHLRGSQSFTWRGMTAQVLPSQFDIEQRDKALIERQAMREAGTDRRPKL